MPSQQLTLAQVAAYHRDGYLVIPGFLQEAAVNKLYRIATEDNTMSKHSYNVNDQKGKKSKLALWFTPGNDAYGLLTRSERMVNAVNQLLEGDAAVCHFHSKLMQKEPRV
ncbi:MAG: phytanoyl-CoA dioxygenase family protein, partial [Chitinophagaceae bacterium]